ncbi:MAG: restriction endonuclease subunit S [Fluviibacter sp.]
MTVETPLIDIRPDHWEIVQGILEKHVPQYAVWAFGSRATWKAKEFSDLDLAIITEHPLTLDISASLSDDFSNSDLPYKVDVVDWASTSESFRKIIERDKVELQASKKNLGIASEWPLRLLGDMLSFSNGKTSPERSDSGRFFVFGSNGSIGSSDITNSPANTIVIGRVGSYCGSTFFSKSECWVTDNAIRANAKAGSDGNFAYYLLQTLNLNERRAGSGQPLLNQSILSMIDVAIPSLEEQRAIAYVLGTLDDKIELNRKQNETLEGMARALFKAWFVVFEPVRAKIEGRWKRGQSLPGLPAHLYDLFPDRLVESELGEIPEGWETQSLGQLLTIIGGGTPKTSNPEYWGGDIPWFSVVDSPQAGDVFVVETEKSITQTGLDTSSARLVPKGTTIISARGTVGNLAIAGRDMAFNQSCYGLRGVGGAGDCFVYLVALQMVSQLKSMAHGSVFSTITRQTFDAIQQPVTPLAVLQEFEKSVAPWFEAILSNVKESRSFAELRDTLLPKLISGELRVLDAERIAGSTV